MSDDGGEKKIIIDEDWKTRAQAEKEVLEKKVHEEPQPEGQQPEEAATDQAIGPLPPASLPVLLSMLASQAMISLGQVPNPITGKAEVRGDEAKHFIDLIGVIEEKTRGNLNEDEAAMISSLLNELRMAFVAIVTKGPSSTPPATEAP